MTHFERESCDICGSREGVEISKTSKNTITGDLFLLCVNCENFEIVKIAQNSCSMWSPYVFSSRALVGEDSKKGEEDEVGHPQECEVCGHNGDTLYSRFLFNNRRKKPHEVCGICALKEAALISLVGTIRLDGFPNAGIAKASEYIREHDNF